MARGAALGSNLGGERGQGCGAEQRAIGVQALPLASARATYGEQGVAAQFKSYLAPPLDFKAAPAQSGETPS